MIKSKKSYVNLPRTNENTNSRWTVEEIAILKRTHKKFTYEQIAELLGRSYGSILQQVQIQGFTETRNPDWTSSELKKLKTMYHRGDKLEDIAYILNRTLSGTMGQLHKRGIKRK